MTTDDVERVLRLCQAAGEHVVHREYDYCLRCKAERPFESPICQLWAWALVTTIPATEGEVCLGPMRDGHCLVGTKDAQYCDCEGSGRIGAQPERKGLLVPCGCSCHLIEEAGHEVKATHKPCPGCHGTGYVLLGKLRSDIEDGEWGAAAGRFLDRLETAWPRMETVWGRDVSYGHWLHLYPDPDIDSLKGTGPTRFAALLNGIERAVQEARA